MNKTVLLALTSALALGSAALAGGGNTAPQTGAAPANCQTIAALVAADPNFSILAAALNAANLTATFAGGGPFTVFAPTNAAFAKIPAADLQALLNDTATLTRVLQYHVVSGKVTAAQVVKLGSAITLGAEPVTISTPGAGVVMFGDATVVRADVNACNGVIHVIDTVLLPPGVPLPSASATTETTDTTTTDTTAADTTATDTAADSGTTTDTGATAGTLPAAISVTQIPVQPLSAGGTVTTTTVSTTTTDTSATTTGAPPATISVSQIPVRPLSGGTATATSTNTATDTTATDTTMTDTTATGTATDTATATTTDTTTTATTTDTTAQGATTDAATQANSISKIAAADPRLSTFLAALKAANLETAFDSPGDYTVFAPTNDAFAKIPQAQLDALLADPEALFEVLNYHVVAGRYNAAQVATLQNPQTLEGDPLTITAGGGGATVNGAALVATDIPANNGVIHLVDTVLLPPNFQLPAPASTASATTDASGTAATGTATTATGATGTAAATTTTSPATGTQTIAAIISTDPNFSTLYTALQAAGLVDTLSGGSFTLFAPTNAAFAKLPAADLQALLADKERLTRVLSYHVVQGLQTASAIGGQSSLTSVAGPILPVTLEGSAGSGNLRVGDALVTQADVTASNGIIQVIDTVLMPPQ